MRGEGSKCWVIGAGAIGSVVAASLRIAGRTRVTLVGRSQHARAVAAGGLFYRTEGQGETQLAVDSIPPAMLPVLGGGDLVVLCLKLPAVAERADMLRGKLQGAGGLIALENGLGAGDWIRERLGRPVDCGLAFFGANCPTPGTVVYYPGRLRLKPSPVTERLADMLEGGPLPCETCPDWRRTEWHKLAINCVANAFSGILRVHNRLITEAALDPAKEVVLEEVRRVAAAEGIPLDTTVAKINRYLDHENTPSLPVDLERGLPTEIDFLNGAVVREAASHEIAAPANTLITSMITFLEKHFAARR